MELPIIIILRLLYKYQTLFPHCQHARTLKKKIQIPIISMYPSNQYLLYNSILRYIIFHCVFVFLRLNFLSHSRKYSELRC